jgi:uncharacterized OB-fold protein
MSLKIRIPAVEGWFTLDDEPRLLGKRCRDCGCVYFPKPSLYCRNPHCQSQNLEEIALSRRGRVWSYTDARYQPPPPYVPRGDTYAPFAIAAVELEQEGIVVLGMVADGFGIPDLKVGSEVELVVEELYSEGDTAYMVWKWRPVEALR